MKKLTVILGISLVLLSLAPITSAAIPGRHLLRHRQPMPTDGNFTGVIAIKNETGYVPVGEFSGTYAGFTFEGTWSEGSATGTMMGWAWGHIFIGQMNVTGMNQSTWFGGLFHVNATASTFRAVSIILLGENYTIRYALGDLE